ncbi:hypothetical protein AB0L63_30120 [Nocardia sp. NPDC051990]|uniref:hypothetical protein n=1 Tax=Nocardia sp. NPDC051990 TaxID=3155285 RepID=UPI0034293940
MSEIPGPDPHGRSAVVTSGARGIGTAIASALVEMDAGVLTSESPAMFRHPLAGDLVGSWLGMHSAAPRLATAGDGVIVNIASTAAQQLPRFGEPQEVAAKVRFIVTEATFSTGSEFVLDSSATAGMVSTTPPERRAS